MEKRKKLCDCCPYGYHIDVDFVQFCDDFARSDINIEDSTSRGPNGRKQGQTIGSLLGIRQNDVEESVKTANSPVPRASPDVQKSFQQAVCDFEELLTQSTSNGKSTSPLYADHSTSNSGWYSSAFPPSYGKQVTPGRISPHGENHLRSFSFVTGKRGNSASSHTKPVEEAKDKMVNKMLFDRNKEADSRSNALPSKYVYETWPLNLTDRKYDWDTVPVESNNKQGVKYKDTATNYAVLTREIGVVSCAPSVRDAAVNTGKCSTVHAIVMTDISMDRIPDDEIIVSGMLHYDIAHTEPKIDCERRIHETGAQTEHKDYKNASVVAIPQMREVFVTVKPDTQDMESECEILQTESLRPTETVFLASLMDCRKTSDDVMTAEVSSIQRDKPNSRSRGTNTIEFKIHDKHKSTQTEQTVFKTVKYKTSATNTEKKRFVDKIVGTARNETPLNTKLFNYEVHSPEKTSSLRTNVAKDTKIPRYKSADLLPSVRRLTRQHTYTVDECQIQTSRKLIIPVFVPRSPSPKFEESLKSEDDITQNQHYLSDRANDDSSFLQSLPQDKPKNKPSREMEAALKILNDSLQRSVYRNVPYSQVKNAVQVIQEEWFKISSGNNADPHVVEDYLHTFEDISTCLLEYVVNMRNGAGNTAMHYAVSHGNFDVVSALLNSKVCNINAVNDAGYTCIMLVSLANVTSNIHREIIKRLFQMGDVNAKAKKHGQTTLMLAVSHGKLDVVRLLLQCGADVNMQDDDGSTVLMCAAEHGYLDMAKLLLSHPDCDLTLKDKEGKTALMVAMEAGHREIGLALYTKEHFSYSSSGTKSTTSVPSSPRLRSPLRPPKGYSNESAIFSKSHTFEHHDGSVKRVNFDYLK